MLKTYPPRSLVLLSILILCLVGFYPALQAGFVNWDDPDYIYNNSVLLENDWSRPLDYLNAIFSQRYRSIYSPITTLTYAIEQAIYGMDFPQGWHFDNILLHALNVFVVYLIVVRMKFSPIVAVLTTVLFAIHPMRVESVAWLTARKDLIFALFFFLGIYAYLRARDQQEQRRRMFIVLVWIFYLLSLLSKVLAVSFPLVLILLDYYLDQKIDAKKLLAKIPYLAVAFLFGVLSIYWANSYKSIGVETAQYTLLDRIPLASSALGVYFAKFIYPYKMIPLYPYPLKMGVEYYFAIIIPVATLGLWLWAYLKEKYLLFLGLGFFLVNIVFTLQLIPVGQGYKADRYTYIAYWGLFLLLAAGIDLLIKRSKNPMFITVISFFLLLVAYLPLTIQQTKIWESSLRLWSHQLRYLPNDPTAHKNLANYFKEVGDPQREYNYLQKALQFDPNDPGINYRMGMLMSEQPSLGTINDAITWLNKAVELDTSFPGLYVNRAVLLAQIGQLQPALSDLKKAEQLDRSNPDIYLNRAVIQNSLGAIEDAIQALDQYLTLRSNDADKWIIKAQMHRQIGDYPKALEAVNQGLAIDPDKGAYYYNRALILDALGRISEAQKDIQTSLNMGYQGQTEIINGIMNK
ncbi:MAG: tetratricopeptide repeat protein [Bacteroidota bacterium]